jgi:hypothetical protein
MPSVRLGARSGRYTGASNTEGSLQKSSESAPSLQLTDNLPYPTKMPPSRASCSTPITLRAQAFALEEEGIPVARIREITRLAIFTIYRIKQIAFERGYDPEICKDEYFIVRIGQQLN